MTQRARGVPCDWLSSGDHALRNSVGAEPYGQVRQNDSRAVPPDWESAARRAAHGKRNVVPGRAGSGEQPHAGA